MTERPIRDVLAECMRRERLGMIRPLWSDWVAFDNDGGCEQVRLRADHLIRLLSDLGVELVQSGEPRQMERLDSPVLWRFKIDGQNAERLVRTAAGGIEILKIDGDKQSIQLTFPIGEAYDLANRGLCGDRELTKEPGVITKLSAALEAHRVNAVGNFGGAA